MEVFSHFQHWHDVLCSPSGVVKSVTDRTKLFRYRWRGTRISPNLFPLEESSQLWKQRAHHLCNDPSRCDAASDYDGIRVISVIGPNDDPPRWALQSGSWGEPSAPAHTHWTQGTGAPERMPLSPSKRNGSTQSDHFKIHLVSCCDFRQNATHGFFLICHPSNFIHRNNFIPTVLATSLSAIVAHEFTSVKWFLHSRYIHNAHVCRL